MATTEGALPLPSSLARRASHPRDPGTVFLCRRSSGVRLRRRQPGKKVWRLHYFGRHLDVLYAHKLTVEFEDWDGSLLFFIACRSHEVEQGQDASMKPWERHILNELRMHKQTLNAWIAKFHHYD